jgi:hypothetical protein
MNRRSIYNFLSRQSISAVAIHKQFVTIIDYNAIAYSTFMIHLKEMKPTAGKEKGIEAEILTLFIKEL